MTCFEIFATKRRLHQRRSITAAALILFNLSAAPALAQFWGHYENTEHSYAIDTPPGFESGGESAASGGAMFYDLAAEQGITLWAGTIAGGVEVAASDEAKSLEAQGWTIQETSTTPQWAMVVAQRDHRVSVSRLIGLCAADSYAGFRMEFHIRDMTRIDEALAGMTRSFAPTAC